jgi:predicted enzyme related to lactoylglutathione lyase
MWKILVLSVFVCGCASQSPVQAPIQAPARTSGAIDYIEFKTTDMAATKSFYAGLFGWNFVDYGPDYASVTGAGVNAGFAFAKKVSTSGPLVVLYARDLEAMELRIRQSGGTIAKAIFSFPGGRRFHFTDPQGNMLAVWSDQGL